MRERNRRQICRWLFLLLGILPTCGVVGYIVAQRLPDVRAAERVTWEELARREMGLRLTIRQIWQPVLGVTSWRNVRLLEPESAVPIADVADLEIRDTPGEFQIIATQVDVYDGKLAEFVELIHERLLRLRHDHKVASLFVADRVLVHQQNNGVTLSQLQAHFLGEGQYSDLKVQFQVAGEKASPDCIVVVRRNRDIVPAETELEVEVGPPGIPLAAFTDLIPGAEATGDASHFQGNLKLTRSSRGWSGVVSGKVRDVNCDDLVSAWLPHKWSGQCEIQIESARLEDGRLLDVKGSIRATQGVIGRSLLMSLAEHLPLQVSKAVVDSNQLLWKYERCELAFQLENKRLKLRGLCDPQGSVIRAQENSLLGTRSAPPASVVALVRALVPENEVQAPATRQTERLLDVLQLPDIVPVHPAQATPRLWIPRR